MNNLAKRINRVGFRFRPFANVEVVDFHAESLSPAATEHHDRPIR